MPLTRYEVRNEYSLADPELYRAADKDDPEALLEGVAMAGLVGVLRQLGDLAEFAAEIFHDLHEEVMATASRGHGLMARVQQLEVDFPSIEKAFLSQSNHSSFYYNPGVDWRHNVRMDQNLITQGDLPRFIMDSYEECRGPPQLFLLDKFDVAGVGACLKRYTDPSFFKEESMSSSMPNAEIHRDKRSRRGKKKGSHWKNGETPDAIPTSRAKLHQLLLEERVESGKSDPARLVKLKRRQLGAHYDSQSGKSYMASFLQTLSPEQKEVHEISISPSPLSDSGLAILNVQTVGNTEDSYEAERSKCSSLTEAMIGNIKDSGSDSRGGTSEIIPNLQIVVIEKDQSVDEGSTAENSFHVPPSDDSLDVASETENYVDALATMESETETDSEYRARSDSHCCNKVKQSSFLANGSQLFDSQSVCNSSSLDSHHSFVKEEVSRHCEIQSHLAEEIQSDLDGAPVVSNSMGGFESEMVAMTFGLHSASEEVSQIKSDESLVLGISCIKIDEIQIPGYETRELSCGSCRTDSHFTIWPSDPKSGAEKILLSEPHIGERSSGTVKLSKESLDTEEIVIHAGIIIASNLEQNVSQPGTVTAFEFDSGEPSAESDALLHLSDGSDLACQQGCSEIVIPYFFNEGHAIEISPSNIVNGDIGSPQSAVLSPEEQILRIELPEVQPPLSIVPSSDAEKCDMVSEVSEDITTGTSENTIPSVDFPGTGNFPDQIQPGKTYIIAPSSATVDDLSSTEIKDFKEASKRYEEIQGNGYNLSIVVCDATSLGILSEYPGENRSLDGKMPPSIQTEDDCLEESVLFSSRNADCEQTEVIEEAFSVRNMGAISRGNGSYEHFDKLFSDDVPNPLRDTNIDILSTWGGVSSPSLDKTEQSIDSSINIQSLALGKASETFQQHDDQDIKECPDDFLSLPGKQTVYPYSISDATSSTTFCEKDDLLLDEIPSLGPSQEEITQGSLSLDGGALLPLQGQLSFETDDPIPSSYKYLSEVETFPKLELELQCDQTDMKDLSTKEEASPTTSDVKSEDGSSSCQSETQYCFHHSGDRSSLCQSETQYCFHHLGETCPDNLQTQEYAPKILQQPKDEKLKHKESSKTGAISASSEMLPLTSKVTGEEIPLVSSSPVGRKVEVGFSGSQVDCLLPENPFMPLKSNNAPEKISPEDMQFAIPLITLSNGSEPRPPPEPSSFPGESVLPNPPPSSVLWEVEGILVDDALIQVDQNLLHPSHQLAPETYSGIEAEDNFQDLQGEMLNQPEVIERLQSGENELPQHSLPADTATYIGEPSNQSTSESFSNNEKAEYAFQDIQGERHNDAKMTNNWQSMIEEPPHQGWRTSEGEIAWSLSLPISGDLNKLSRPRNPLIDAMAAHDKSKLRKVAERIRPQISPVINERGSLLEQIRTKSFNLKPAVVTRPSVQGPKTHLKISAILEKANAIRQATAGSDEDEDSWSDS